MSLLAPPAPGRSDTPTYAGPADLADSDHDMAAFPYDEEPLAAISLQPPARNEAKTAEGDAPGCALPPPTAEREDWLVAFCARFLGRERARAALSIGDQAIVSGTNFVTSVLIGRAAGKEALGVYLLALCLIQFVRGVQEQTVYGPYLIFCHKRKGSRLARYAGSVLTHEGLWLLATALGLTGLAVYLNLGGEPSGLRETSWVLIAAAPLILFREFARHIAFGHFRSGTAVALDVGVAVLQIAGLGALSLWGALDVPSAFGIMGAACLLVCWPWCLRFARGVRFRAKAVATDWRRNWTFGRWALATHLLHGASSYLMPWVVALVDGEAATGIFAAGSTLVGIANMFVLGLAHYVCPKAAERFHEDGVPGLRRVLRGATLVFSAALGPFVLICWAFGDELAALVFTDAFAGAGMVLTALAVNMWANALSMTCGNGLWAVERPDANFSADVLSLVIVGLCTAALIGAYGVVGAAVAMAIGGWVDVFARYFALRGVLKSLEGGAS
ncbi:lipopolysaccharide biosynthesis protein [Alienimonas sp. DA493]|uniref:lipopolysaccharide biosynthesis protein n=1 Tax=Alienimonas sp. DA493 TaxID=3373605 RepID=UPI0037546801